MRRVLLSAVVGLVLAAAASPAVLAQTAGGSGTPQTQGFGTTSTGGTITGDLCNPAFTPGTTVTLTNGFDGKSTSGPGGDSACTTTGGAGKHVTYTIGSTASNNTVPNSTLGDPVTVTVACGTNTVTGSGGGATQSGTFSVTCAVATPVTAAPTNNVAFTGANIARWTGAAAALLAIGGLMVWGSRRRRPTLDR
jgi:hypothetical protein